MITCKFEDGGEALLRHITVNVIVVKDRKVLLGRRGTLRGKKISEHGKLGLLGGFFDRDETLIQAAEREVFEESGWRISGLTLLRINDNPHRPMEDRQNVDSIFFANAIIKEGESDEEVTNLEWHSLENLPEPEEIAFDHHDSLMLYKKYLKEPFPLPVIGKIT